MARCWHLRKLIWDLLPELRSPDGLGTGVQVEVGEVSSIALQAFLPERGMAVEDEFKGAVLGGHRWTPPPLPMSGSCPLLSKHQLYWGLGLISAPVPCKAIEAWDRPRFSLPQNYVTRGPTDALTGMIPWQGRYLPG